MTTNLSKTHFVCEDTVFAFGPKISKPVEAGQLKVFEFAACFLYVIRILSDFLKLRSVVLCVKRAFERELGFRFTFSVRLDLFLRNGLDVLGEFPGAVLVIETLPFTEIL